MGLAALDTWRGTMAWHQRHRLGLLRARLALAAGDAGEAAHLAGAVRDDAARRGAITRMATRPKATRATAIGAEKSRKMATMPTGLNRADPRIMPRDVSRAAPLR